MTSSRRIGSKTSKTRSAILKAALEVLQEEGRSHFTASAIAKRAKLKPHMVHYYFRSMDDLVLELVKTLGSTGLKNSARAISTDQPLRALWDIEMGSTSNVAIMELGAMAAHNDDVRQAMAGFIEQMRTLQAEAVASYLADRGVASPIPPVALTMMISGIARQLVRERDFNVSLGHEEVSLAVEALLDRLLDMTQQPERSAASKS